MTFLGPKFKNAHIQKKNAHILFVPPVLIVHYQCDEMSKYYFLQRQKKNKNGISGACLA